MRQGISFDELAAVLQIRRGNRDNFGRIIHIFTAKTYFVTNHQNRLVETLLMRSQNICFH